MKVYVIAGELSGDKLGASLMRGLKAESPTDIEFRGVGGPLMQAEGLSSQFPMQELSVMGLVEILPKYFHLKRRIKECAEAIADFQPDVVVTIDSPDFCLRVAKLVREAGDTRIVHYVAPSVWAWRPKRAEKMAGIVDQVLALLPFEPPYMQAHGMRCDFVGHPVVAEPVANDQEIAAFKAHYRISDDPMVLVLPGSRKGEVSRLLPIFLPALDMIRQARPEVQFVLPAAAPVAEMIEEMMADQPYSLTTLDPRGLEAETFAAHKRAAFKTADVALAASGTVSLELCAASTPMVIAYDVNKISRMIMKRMLLIDTVTLPNLVTDTRHIPEFIGEACQPDHIAQGVLNVLADPSAQQLVVADTMRLLGRGQEEAGVKAARAILDGLSEA